MDFFDWSDECAAEIALAIAALSNPISSGADPRNPYARDPETEQLELQLELQQYWDGNWYEQRLHLDRLTGLPRGKQRMGFEVSTMSYILQDIEDPTCIPFLGGGFKGQKVRLKLGTQWLFKGELELPQRIPHHQYTALSPRCRYQINCVNEINLFHRVPIFEIIRNTTEGAMLADLCSRYAPELDATGINLLLGDDIEEHIIAGQYLDEVFQEVLKNNPNAAFFLDISQDQSRIYLDDRSSPDLLLPVTISDANLYGNGDDIKGFCRPGDWNLAQGDKTYRNSVIVKAPLLYNTGLADFFNASNIVLGTSNAAGWYQKIYPGMRLRKTGSNSTYTVAENHSTGAPVDDIRIQGNYQEVTAASVAYEIIGDEEEYLAEDSNEQARRAAYKQEIGPNAGLVRVILTISTPLTADEGERLAELSLRLDSWEGYFKTDNRKFPCLPHAGKVLRHDAELHGVKADVPIAELDWAVQGAYAPTIGGEDAAWVTWNMSFTDRTQATEQALLQILLRERKSKLRDYDKLTIQKGIGERYLIKDCVHATEGIAVEEAVEDSDSLTATDISAIASSTGPWYPSPGTPYGSPIIAIDPDDPTTYWFAS